MYTDRVPIKRIFLAFNTKILSATIVFVYHIILTKYLSIEAVGIYFSFYMAMILASALLRFGSDQLFIKNIASRNELDQNTFNIIYLIFLINLVALIASIFLEKLNHNIYTSNIHIVLTFVFISVLSAILKGFNKVKTGLFLSNGSFQLISCIIIILLIDKVDMNLELFFDVLFISMVITAVISIYLLNKERITYFYPSKEIFTVGYSKELTEFLSVNFVSLLFPWTGVAILTLLGTNEETALLGIGMRIITLYGFIYISVISVINPIISRLYALEELIKIKKIVSRINKILFCISLISYVFLFLTIDIILSLFGNEYLEAKYIILLMAVGQAINILTGPCSSVLSMCNRISIVKRNSIISAAFLIILSLVLYFYFSVIGIAIGYSISMIIYNLLNYINTKKFLGNLNEK